MRPRPLGISKLTGDLVMSLVDLGEVALTQQVVEVEDVVLNLLAGYLLTLLLAHPPSFDDNLIITYIIH